jgi:hypothetical protein
MFSCDIRAPLFIITLTEPLFFTRKAQSLILIHSTLVEVGPLRYAGRIVVLFHRVASDWFVSTTALLMAFLIFARFAG